MELTAVVNDVIAIQKINHELKLSKQLLVDDLVNLYSELGNHRAWDAIAALQIPADVRATVFKIIRETEAARVITAEVAA